MFQACKTGNLDKLIELKKYNVSTDLSLANKSGFTPMHLAAKYNHLHIIEWLNNNGAAQDVTIEENIFKRTPLFTACQLNYLNIVSWLFIHGAAEDISKSDINGITPMYIACQNNNIEICQFIYDHGGSKDINRPDSSGFTPMLAACQDGHINIVKWIFEHDESDGIDGVKNCISRGCNMSWTPMFVACQGGYLELIQWLHDNGGKSDLFIRVKDGQTCWDIVNFKNFTDCIKQLREYNGHIIPHSNYFLH